ncbi:ABC transporter permease [Aureisphaera galaxeae]|uniref:ABC transporter permease n=1 Tax=Aureisphaera galaxeae TaxID=1538023 RepID=UPI002350C257|nr:FtsX-like permease family protein [Aureisphaera galaxeae]MDC8004479.1 ABC transporter permease [Aureisphaera galaxeae]
MNFEYFVARRIAASKDYKSSISAPIIKIAITAIALGLAIMMVSVATGVGLQKKIREKVSAFNGDIVISNYDTNYSNDSQTPIFTDQDFYPEFNLTEGVDHIQAIALKGGVIRTETDFEGVVVKGVGSDFRWDFFEEYLKEGRLPDFSGNLNDEILLSKYHADRLGFTVGDRVNTFFLQEGKKQRARSRGFTIVGIYSSGFQQFDEQFLMADIRHVQRLNNWEEDFVGAFELFVSDFDNIQEVGNKVYEEIPSTLDSQTIRDKYYTIFEWLDLFDFNIFLIIGIMIVIAGINMSTALLVLILERTQMIGILKAIGTTDWSVRKIFLYNAGYIVSVGLFWGNLIGIGLLLIQKYGKVISLDPETYYVTEAPIHFDLGHILLLNVGTLLLCLIMLLGPSRFITKISPVKAIRFE